MACLTIWNTAEIMAWDAMMADRVATTNMGQKTGPGREFQNMALHELGLANRYDPCISSRPCHNFHAATFRA